MNLLRGQDPKQPKPKPKAQPKPVVTRAVHPMDITRWPEKREPQGLGLSFKDGWNFGVGFGLALAIAVPLILIVASCAISFLATVLGVSFGGLF